MPRSRRARRPGYRRRHPTLGCNSAIETLGCRLRSWQDRDGAEVSRDTRELPVELFATNRIVEHRATLPLARLQPGEYLLTFEARSGSQIEQGRVRFKVDGL